MRQRSIAIDEVLRTARFHAGPRQIYKQDYFALAQKLGATGTLLKPIEPAVLLKLADETAARAV